MKCQEAEECSRAPLEEKIIWPGMSRIAVFDPDALRCKCGVVALQVIVDVQPLELNVQDVIVVGEVPNCIGPFSLSSV